jgi:aminoglycoside 6'-N-acetyltransferase
MNITFKPLEKSHFSLLLKWLESPHVKIFWDKDIQWTSALIEEKYGSYVEGYKVERGLHKEIHTSIIFLRNIPVGYIQLYNAHHFPRSLSLENLPKNLGGFDIFIGERDYMGQGIGPKATEQFLDQYASDYTHIFADPDVSNIRAIRAYEKAGFKILEDQPVMGEVWMMKDMKGCTLRRL